MQLEDFLELARRYVEVGYTKERAIWLTLIEVSYKQEEVAQYLEEHL